MEAQIAEARANVEVLARAYAQNPDARIAKELRYWRERADRLTLQQYEAERDT